MSIAEDAQDRWRRYQARARRRSISTLPGPLAHLLARSKWPGRVALIAQSGLWDRTITVGLGSRPAPADTLTAYVRAGPDPHGQPRTLMDQAWYLRTTPGVAGSAWSPLAHYLILGDRLGFSPHPLFDPAGYRRQVGARCGGTALQHFMAIGAAEGLNPHPLFDLRHYVGQCEAVAESGENPVVHYLREGWREGLDPHPLFEGAWYLAQNPDARAAKVAPLLHYLSVGAAAGLDPHPLFDTAFYRRRRRGALRGGDALSDYLAGGAREARSPSPHFDAAAYLLDAEPEARANPLGHALAHGAGGAALAAALSHPRTAALPDEEAIYRATRARDPAPAATAAWGPDDITLTVHRPGLPAPTLAQRRRAARYGLRIARAGPGPGSVRVEAKDSPGRFRADLEAALDAGARTIFVGVAGADILEPEPTLGHAWLEACAQARDAELVRP